MKALEDMTFEELEQARQLRALVNHARTAAIYDHLAAGEVLRRFIVDEVTFEGAWSQLMDIINPETSSIPIGRA